MALCPSYCHSFCNDPCNLCCSSQLDFCNPWNCCDTFSSSCCIPPQIIRCSVPCQPFTEITTTTTTTNETCCQPRKVIADSEKLIIRLSIAELNPDTIKTIIKDGKLVVEASREDRGQHGDYNIRQFRKTYEIPKNADIECMTSHVTLDDVLVIEVPIRKSENQSGLTQTETDTTLNDTTLNDTTQSYSTQNDTSQNYGALNDRAQNYVALNDTTQNYATLNGTTQSSDQTGDSDKSLSDYITLLMNSDFHPRLITNGDNKKVLEMSIDVKKSRPEEINVSLKNNELTVRGEHKTNENNHARRARFFRQTTLPSGAQIDQLKTVLKNDGHLKIEVPLN
ncbi:unnamed protein product [Adineta steineri]|uniref:SHSP domain-containing protein n=1 Tax=Adineta steineri TaxID=433720 RepID=A0A813QNB2_9BILA|nr:unnamed protein product [Adineta steineri]